MMRGVRVSDPLPRWIDLRLVKSTRVVKLISAPRTAAVAAAGAELRPVGRCAMALHPDHLAALIELRVAELRVLAVQTAASDERDGHSGDRPARSAPPS